MSAVLSSLSRLSVVVPVFNNQDTLEELHVRLVATLTAENEAFEIVFVDDASRDASRDVLRRIADRDSRCQALMLEANVGQHCAILAGMEKARGEWTLIMDADLQDPPEAIPALLARRRSEVGAIFGGRLGDYESFGRSITSRGYKLLQHWLIGVPVDAGLFVLVNARLKSELLRLRGPIVVAIGSTGMPTLSVPVQRSWRQNRGTSYTAWGRFKSAWRSLSWVARRKCGNGRAGETGVGG